MLCQLSEGLSRTLAIRPFNDAIKEEIQLVQLSLPLWPHWNSNTMPTQRLITNPPVYTKWQPPGLKNETGEVAKIPQMTTEGC